MGKFNIGNGMYRGGNTYVPDYVEYVVDKKMDKVTSQLREHREQPVLDHPDGSVTNNKLAPSAVTIDKIHSSVAADNLTTNSSNKLLTARQGYVMKSQLDSHKAAVNPHNITKTTVGLSNVDNTSDSDKPISTATQLALADKADLADTLSGYGILDAYTKQEIDTKFEYVVTIQTGDDAIKIDKLPDDKSYKLVVSNNVDYGLPGGVYRVMTLAESSASFDDSTHFIIRKSQRATKSDGAVYQRKTHKGDVIISPGDPETGEPPVVMEGQVYGEWVRLENNKTVSVTIAPYGGAGDYICTGTSDEVIINQALNAATANGIKPATVIFMPGSYTLSGAINVPANVTVTAYQASFSIAEGSDNIVSAGNSVMWSGGDFSTAEFGGGLIFGSHATVRDISNGTYGGMTAGNYSTIENCQDGSMNGLSFGSYCSITGCKSSASYAGYQSTGTDNILIGNRYDGSNNGYMLNSGGFYPEDTTLFKALNLGKLIVDNVEV